MKAPAQRLHDWQTRLHTLVMQRWGMAFGWGVNDCCLFAADAVQAVTGVDLAADLRGRYATAAEAARVLDELGGVLEIAAARLGPEVSPGMAQPGDVGATVQAGRDTLAVNAGGHWFAPAPIGLVVVYDHQVQRAWRCVAEA